MEEVINHGARGPIAGPGFEPGLPADEANRLPVSVPHRSSLIPYSGIA